MDTGFTCAVERWSWWQLFLDAFLHISQFGPWYDVKTKKWLGGILQPSETFQRKARWFSKCLSKISRACGVEIPMQHALPSGAMISFWTAKLPVRVPLARTEALDNWFGTFFPCASKTADFCTINLWAPCNMLWWNLFTPTGEVGSQHVC